MTGKRKPLNDYSTLASEKSNKGDHEIQMSRYEKAKKKTLSQANYIKANHDNTGLVSKIRQCGSYLVFHDYINADAKKLCGMKSCHEHLLCPLCAIRRGAKTNSAYMERLQIILKDNPKLKPYFVTLTVKNGDNLKERFEHLQKNVRYLGKKRHLKKVKTEAQKAHGAVWSFEIKRGKNSNEWHPHCHMIWLCEEQPNQQQLSEEWHKITGDSFIVDVRPLRGSFDNENGEFFKSLCEVFKYAVKFSEQPNKDTFECFTTLKGRRLLGAFGNLYGVKVPEKLTDDPMKDEPYIELFYRYAFGKYQLEKSTVKNAISSEPQPTIQDAKQVYLSINLAYSKDKKPQLKIPKAIKATQATKPKGDST